MIKTWLAGLFALAITAPTLAQTPPPRSPTLAVRMVVGVSVTGGFGDSALNT